MNQLQIIHKKSTNSAVSKNKNEELENKREDHGRNIALTRNVFRIENSDTFYCQSESTDIYYFVRYMPSVFEHCSCCYNSIRGQFCKHLHAVIFSITKGTLKEVDKLPTQAKTFANQNKIPVVKQSSSWRDSQYDY